MSTSPDKGEDLIVINAFVMNLRAPLDVIVRPSIDQAERTTTLTRIWGDPVTVEGVQIRTVRPTSSPDDPQ
jgi:hypothetical protein